MFKPRSEKSKRFISIFIKQCFANTVNVTYYTSETLELFVKRKKTAVFIPNNNDIFFFNNNRDEINLFYDLRNILILAK